MKAILVCFLFLAFAFGQLVQTSPLVFTEKRLLKYIPSQSSQTIRVPVRHHFIINLPANPTPLSNMAYRWIVKNLPSLPPKLHFDDTLPTGVFIFPNFPSFYGGRQLFSFTTLAKGLVTIKFWYVRPLQANPLKVYYVVVSIY